MAGVDELHWAGLEGLGDANFAVVGAMTATDACPLIEETISPERDFKNVEEHRGTASPLGWILGKFKGQWGARMHLKTRAAGTEPDKGIYFQAAMRSAAPTIVGGTSVTYAFEAAVPRSLRSLNHQPDGSDGTEPLTQWLYGKWVEKLSVKQEENNYPIVEASGGYAHMGWLVGVPQTDGSAYNNPATQVVLSALSAFKIGAGAYVRFGGTRDNSGAGYLVTAVSADGRTLTFTPALTVGDAIPAVAQNVTAVVPSQSIGGTIQSGIEHVLTLDGVSIQAIKANITINTGIHGLDGDSTAQRVNAIRRGDRSYEGELEFYARNESLGNFGRSIAGPGLGYPSTPVQVPLSMQFGAPSAGNRLVTAMPLVRLYTQQLNRDTKKEARHMGAFFPRMNAAAEDELTHAFT
jgi:hypothetical protein